MRKNIFRTYVMTVIFACVAISTAQAAEPESCKEVRIALINWADIQATTGATETVLQALGYETKQQLTDVGVAFIGMEKNDTDVFLGNWMPIQTDVITPFVEKGAVEVVRTNLEGAKFTLAVPTYVAEGGLKDFADIAKHSDEIGGKIYGIEAGSGGNQVIEKMLAANAFELGDVTLVASSEAGMLTQVDRAIKRDDWIVFLGWEPHPMNTKFDMTYLTGGDDWFGPNFGGATVHTIARKGYAEECPNLGKFFQNLEFTLAMENEIMGPIIEDKEDPQVAASAWLKAHPDAFVPWLEGVTTVDGGDANEAVRKHLGL